MLQCGGTALKYLHQNVTDEADIEWLCWFTKFEESTIAAFKDYFVRGWPANLAAARNGLDKDNFNKKLLRLEEIEAHVQSRINKEAK